MKKRYAGRIKTPLGVARAVVDEGGALVQLDFEDGGERRASQELERRCARRGIGLEWSQDALRPLTRALERYFRGELRAFDLPLAPEGSPFQRKVWRALCRVPYGATVSYGELARRIGRPGASRAVGRANATNPISVVIPCHRVIGADGTLTGYGGGLKRKQKLLDLESGGSGERKSRTRRAQVPSST